MSRWLCGVVMVSFSCLVCLAAAMPTRRSSPPDLAARRRSASERNFIRFGRSPYPESPDLQEDSKHPRYGRARQDNVIRLGRSDNFLRFGRSKPLSISEEDLLNLFRASEEDYERYEAAKRRNNFLRLGRRDDSFLRYGRSAADAPYPGVEVNGELTIVRKQPKFKKDSFLRLGRAGADGSSETVDDDENEERKKPADCIDCAEN